MGRIAAAFDKLRKDGAKGFIPFITAGDPSLEVTELLLLELSKVGATVIELGIPFSDPMADGPVIQRASERALQRRFSIDQVLEMVSRVRKQIDTPIILFSYFNPLLQFGIKRLAKVAAQVGVDGVLVTDLIPEEATEFASELRANQLDMIFLVAPTSTDARLALIAKQASGFVYAVSRAGVTGAQETVSVEAERLVTRVRAFTDLPIAVGFGISTRSQVIDVQRYADAVVVGSAIVQEIERLGEVPDLPLRIGHFAKSLITS